MNQPPAETGTVSAGDGRWNLWLGFGTLVLVGLCLTVWFPRDIGSGFLQQSLTGNTVPGDAFFPVLLVLLMVPLAVLLIASALRGNAGASEQVGRLDRGNLAFLLRTTLITCIALAIMHFSGRLVVSATNLLGWSDFSSYRAASGTFPYNVSGFLLGATFLTAAFIHMTRHRLRARHLLVALLSTVALIALFAGVLDNIQLPPNADL